MLPRLASSVILLGLVAAQTKVVEQTHRTVQGDLYSDTVRDAVLDIFDEDLKKVVQESCIASSEAILATLKDRLLSDLSPLKISSPPPVFCCNADVKREDYFDALGTGEKKWRLAFRGTPNIGKSVYQAFVDGAGVPTNHERSCMQLNTSLPCSNHYRNNRVLDKWENIDDVAFVIYKNNTRVQHIVFDAEGTSYIDWFQQSKVKSSSWVDLKTGSFNFFSIAGVTTSSYTRRFYINRSHGGCPVDNGWFTAIDRVGIHCPWEKDDSFPVFRYVAGNHSDNWTTGNTDTADFIAVFVKYYPEF